MAYVIKRYSNRKLYDTQESRYVTLEELEELIRAGREISVVDVSSGEDLTSVTLAQIILENERNHRAALPTVFLHQLIKHGEAWQDFVQKSLRSSLEGLMTSQREADRVLREWVSRAGWLTATGPEQPAKAEKRAEPAEADALREEVTVLREQLRTLEERLEKKREK
ncbi:MAG: polyhydroxyalkanoate synthesis regulator DNA-binding domain-containing protein [Candidatus Rokuibacteriota bacterium]|jgi:polyhydroxyalkanoate synthesis repressor PhaR